MMNDPCGIGVRITSPDGVSGKKVGWIIHVVRFSR